LNSTAADEPLMSKFPLILFVPLLFVDSVFAAAPANDAFANRIVLVGTNLSTTGSNLSATKELNEPRHGTNDGGASVWWSWTAPTTGRATISTIGSDFDTVLAVYTGTSVSALATVVSDDESGGNHTSLLNFYPQAGMTYQIAVDGFLEAGFPVSTGNIQLHLLLEARPGNDDFASRSTLTGTNVTATSFNVNASKETGEPNHAGDIGGKSVWWTWTAPATRSMIVSTVGSGLDTLLAVYTGTTVSNLTLVASDDEGGGNRTSLTNFSAVAGTTYQIAVDGFQGASGSIVLNLAPNNDRFADRVALTGTNFFVLGSNLSATKETGEPNHAGNGGGKSIWWTWTAPANGSVTFSTVGSGFDTLLAVYTGTAVNGLTEVASNDDEPTGAARTSLLTFTVTNATTYQIAVDGFNGAAGAVVLTLGFNNIPAILSRTARLPDLSVRVDLAGGAGSSYGLEASTNLTNWTRLTTVVSTNGLSQFFDTGATNLTRRFYRAVSP
jgi:hypothetical protein